MNLREIKKIDWQYVAKRRNSVIFWSITDKGYYYFPKITKISWRPNYMLRFNNGEFFHSAKDLNKLKTIFLKQKFKALCQFRNSLITYVTALDKTAQKIETIDFSRLTSKELLSLLNKYIKAAQYAHNFLTPILVVGKVISQMILDLLPKASEQQQQQWLNIFTYPNKENEYVKEVRSFYKLALAYKSKNKNFNQRLISHLKKFSWIGARGFWWNQEWTSTDIKNRLANFFNQQKNPLKELRHLDNIRKEQATTAKKLLKQFNVKKSSELYKLIILAKEYTYLRTWRTDIIYRSGFKVRSLFYEIAKRAGLKQDNVFYLTFEEIIQMAKTKKLPISRQELKKRKQCVTCFFIKNKFIVLSGKQWQKKLQTIIGPKPEAVKEIKGDIAFTGKAKGLAKVVFTSDDLKKVKKGDVLVAVMTFPQFVIAMEKAAAFVTDEGGILCHAAIVSREMKKPCIINTKIATKVLKDGDKVEVDAEQGIVRKL